MNPQSITEWLDYWQQLHAVEIDLGLERVSLVYKQLQLTAPATVFTVAGTNGKGSTTTLLARVAEAAGRRVGLYQSPHINVFNERIAVNGAYISDADFCQVSAMVEAARLVAGVSLSFFEALTLIALVYFAQQQCDVWVLEVGLGGRLDAVNVVDPTVAVITNIGLDHQDRLGNTLAAIAREKCGIMRACVPTVYSGDSSGEAFAVIDTHAKNLQAPLYALERDFAYAVIDQNMLFSSASVTLSLPLPQLAEVNVATAVAAWACALIELPVGQLGQVLANATMPGRFERSSILTAQGLVPVVLDCAHNPDGVAMLLGQLKRVMACEQITRVHWVWSMLADKDMASSVQLAKEVVDCWHVAPLDVPRAAPLENIQDALAKHSIAPLSYATIAQAFAGAMQLAHPHELVVVTGSFYVLEAVKAEIERGNDERTK